MSNKKKFILHTGFEITFSDENIEQLKSVLINKDVIKSLKSKIITAVMFYRSEKQEDMLAFYKRFSKKGENYGYIKSLFIREDKNAIVAIIFLEAKSYYIVLTDTLLNSSPLELKRLADKGDLGHPIDINIKVNAKPYIIYNE